MKYIVKTWNIKDFLVGQIIYMSDGSRWMLKSKVKPKVLPDGQVISEECIHFENITGTPMDPVDLKGEEV